MHFTYQVWDASRGGALNLSFPQNVLSFMRQSVTFTGPCLNQGNIILG